jgi:hypothetical protein
VHRYVEQMDKYYGNVCELDIIFNFQKAYFILDELLIAGEMQETSKKNVLRCISQQDSLEDMEVSLNISPIITILRIVLSFFPTFCFVRKRMNNPPSQRDALCLFLSLCPHLIPFLQPWPSVSQANYSPG